MTIAQVYQKREVEIEQYFVIRGVNETNKVKKVVAELEVTSIPSKDVIAQFLVTNPEVDFCSIETNYRIVGFLGE